MAALNSTAAHPLLPLEWNELNSNLVTQFGISPDTAALLILESFAIACGDMIQIRTPDRIDLSPSFHLALVSNGVGLLRGAIAALIEPIQGDAEVMREYRDERGVATVKQEWESYFERLNESLRLIKELKVQAASAESPEGYGKLVNEYGGRIFAVDRENEERRKLIQEKTEKWALEAKFFDRMEYALHPDIIVDEPHWRDLRAACAQSFDGNALAMCFSNGPLELVEMSPLERKECAEQLKRQRHGAPGITMVTSADEIIFAEILSQRALRKSEILNQFLFVEVGDGDQADPTVFGDQSEMERFHTFMMKRFEDRAKGCKKTPRIRLPDERGFIAYFDLRKWVHGQQQDCAPQVAPFLSMLPNLALRLTLTRAAMEGLPEGLLNGEFVEHSVEFLKRMGLRQRMLLERMINAQTDDELLEAQIEKVIRKLEIRGPLTKRSIARTMHDQGYEQIEPALKTAVERGRLERRGEFYVVPNVSVSASAAA